MKITLRAEILTAILIVFVLMMLIAHGYCVSIGSVIFIVFLWTIFIMASSSIKERFSKKNTDENTKTDKNTKPAEKVNVKEAENSSNKVIFTIVLRRSNGSIELEFSQ